MPSDTLPLCELFYTIQGEGHLAGMPSVFVRLQGCPVGCPWCDTKYTWDAQPALRVSLRTLLDECSDGEKVAQGIWAPAQVDELADIIRANRQFPNVRHVVITGGEPAMHDLRDFTALLHFMGYTTQLETSGTFEIKVDADTWVTVSPKLDMPGGYAVLHDAIARADEIKMAVGKADDIFALQDRVLPWTRAQNHPIVYLQPVSLSKKATEICLGACIAHGYRLSLQIHRMIDVR
jgi:7-carboxy-7-deazaguanine synthase